LFRRRTRDEWTAFAAEHDCCLEPVLDLDEALAHEQTIARGMVVELDQPRIGPVRQVGFPISLSRTPAAIGRPAPALGEQTDEVLDAIGYDRERIDGLRAEGVV
jgi:crotonobetainyl-CoA:carnitine CoA-transferase CaiB-like acyl-CoA transferase